MEEHHGFKIESRRFFQPIVSMTRMKLLTLFFHKFKLSNQYSIPYSISFLCNHKFRTLLLHANVTVETCCPRRDPRFAFSFARHQVQCHQNFLRCDYTYSMRRREPLSPMLVLATTFVQYLSRFANMQLPRVSDYTSLTH